MSESESSTWTTANEKQSITPDGLQKNPGMIEVPDWGKDRPREGDAGYEAGFDDNPFENGKEIIVRRHGKDGAPDYTEGGWKIIDDDATVKTGKDQYMVGVVVSKTVDGISYEKSIPLNEVYGLNPRKTPEAREAVGSLTEVQEDIADEAIEDAIGLKNPEGTTSGSEIDENAHMYSAEEIRTAREAAMRLAEAPEARTETLDPLGQLTEGLSQNDRMELRSYADAQIGKREAQKAGDGNRSIQEGQYMGQALQAMSPAAKAIANRYAALYEQL